MLLGLELRLIAAMPAAVVGEEEAEAGSPQAVRGWPGGVCDLQEGVRPEKVNSQLDLVEANDLESVPIC